MAAPTFRPATEADRDAWQAHLARLPTGDLLHDWGWAAVASHDGQPQRRFVMAEGEQIVAICAAQVRRTALGRSFWYVPHGPVLDYTDPAAAGWLRRMVSELRAAARADGGIAVRIEPRVEADSRAAALFDLSALRRVDATLQSGQTYLVDLLDDPEEQMASLDKDTRYAVRRSEREGVTTEVIDEARDEAALERLHAIVTETLRHHNYRLPSLERYRLAWRGLAGSGRARIIEAWYRGRLESSAMLVVEGDRSYYLYSGSIREEKGETKRFPSYAAQWRMLRTAHEMGARVHDLWGVAPLGAGRDHPWYGYTLFKKGWGGRYVAWAGSWDLVVDPFIYRVRELAGTGVGLVRRVIRR
jgi:lipid II:glycine glycyltransferase (peptidoglycan interpeptide bridge formation enzyme)